MCVSICKIMMSMQALAAETNTIVLMTRTLAVWFVELGKGINIYPKTPQTVPKAETPTRHSSSLSSP